jgi:hypothetical protein
MHHVPMKAAKEEGVAARSEAEVWELLDLWVARCGSVQGVDLRLALDAVGRTAGPPAGSARS